MLKDDSNTSATSFSVGIRGTRYVGNGFPGAGVICKEYFFNIDRRRPAKLGVGPIIINIVDNLKF